LLAGTLIGIMFFNFPLINRQPLWRRLALSTLNGYFGYYCLNEIGEYQQWAINENVYQNLVIDHNLHDEIIM
jgi:hypothetical protein